MSNFHTLILIALVASVLLAIPNIIETSSKPNKSDLNNSYLVYKFCNYKGYSDGTTWYLDTFKNMNCNIVGGFPVEGSCKKTWYEFQTEGSGFNKDAVFCFGNSTGRFYQKQFKEWVDKNN